MSSADVPSGSGAGALAIGRYFVVVSLVPSTVFVAYLTLLVRSGAWGSSAVRFGDAVAHVSARDLAESGIASLLIALTLHPLQFALIQAFEGFWGSSRLATWLALRNVLRHRRRADALHSRALEEDINARPAAVWADKREPAYAARPDAGTSQIRSLLSSGEAWREYNSYPHELDRVMPTRLGNILRRYEVLAGAQYGLESIASVPLLLQVADARDVAYVQNQRMQMELALRTSLLGLAASGTTLAFMWKHGLWLLLALVPYAVAFAAYRGAVVIAHEYGTSLAVLIALNRFTLYDRLHLPLPDDIEDERRNNRLLINVLRLDNTEVEKRLNESYLDYVHPAAPESPSAQAGDASGDKESGEHKQATQ